ncbi:MAG: hypothetical protein AAGA67_15095, partial [Cyanobacteria bacterium P01_F01_bin.153]
VDEAETLDDGTLQILPTGDKDDGQTDEEKEDGDENSAGKNAVEEEPVEEAAEEIEIGTVNG